MIPAILGIAPETNFPRESPLEVWDRLVNGTPDRLADVKAVAKSIENGLREMCRKRGAGPVGPTGSDDGTGALRGHPFGLASCPSDPQENTITVVKVALWHTTDAWAVDGPPDWYVTQVQWELDRHEAQSANVGILLSGGAWRAGAMGRDDGMQAEIVAAVRQFLEMVDKRVPPDPSAQIDLPIIKDLYDRSDEPQVDLPPAALPAWERLKELQTSIRRASAEAKVLESEIRASLRNATEGVLPSGTRLALRKWGAHGKRLVELD